MGAGDVSCLVNVAEQVIQVRPSGMLIMSRPSGKEASVQVVSVNCGEGILASASYATCIQAPAREKIQLF